MLWFRQYAHDDGERDGVFRQKGGCMIFAMGRLKCNGFLDDPGRDQVWPRRRQCVLDGHRDLLGLNHAIRRIWPGRGTRLQRVDHALAPLDRQPDRFLFPVFFDRIQF